VLFEGASPPSERLLAAPPAGCPEIQKASGGPEAFRAGLPR